MIITEVIKSLIQINDIHSAGDYTFTMIKVLQKGVYQLFETKKQIKILLLDEKNCFAWIHAQGIGEILVTSHAKHTKDCTLAAGQYRIYDVIDEPDLTDLQHLELSLGNGTWQGYLLTNGLPTEEKKRNRIIPTDEVITKTTH